MGDRLIADVANPSHANEKLLAGHLLIDGSQLGEDVPEQ